MKDDVNDYVDTHPEVQPERTAEEIKRTNSVRVSQKQRDLKQRREAILNKLEDDHINNGDYVSKGLFISEPNKINGRKGRKLTKEEIRTVQGLML